MITAVNAVGVGYINCVILNAPPQVNSKYTMETYSNRRMVMCIGATVDFRPKACVAP